MGRWICTKDTHTHILACPDSARVLTLDGRLVSFTVRIRNAFSSFLLRVFNVATHISKPSWMPRRPSLIRSLGADSSMGIIYEGAGFDLCFVLY